MFRLFGAIFLDTYAYYKVYTNINMSIVNRSFIFREYYPNKFNRRK